MNIGFKFDNTYIKLGSDVSTKVVPTRFDKPKLVLLNHSLAKQLGLNFELLDEHGLSELFTGGIFPEGAEPIAQAYAGHAFANNLLMLGDGRSMLLGEHMDPSNKRYDIHLKGTGKTVYSRCGSGPLNLLPFDGKAALGPMLREYIISEAMYHLNIRTTRSLAVATTGENVMRETVLPGAILTRVAESHIRVGTFEYLAIKKDIKNLKKLLEYTVARHFPDISGVDKQATEFLKLVMQRQIDLIVDWMRVGFIHGVMNTDNMAISGESLDFGPCAFMDRYDPNTFFSCIDQCGRYAFGKQPSIAQWNLARLADAILPLIDDDRDVAMQTCDEIIDSFTEKYKIKFHKMMKAKLGLVSDESGDIELFHELLDILEKHSLDYTNTFVSLMNGENIDTNLKSFYNKWTSRICRQDIDTQEVIAIMKKTNPVVIPRNHKVDEAIGEAHNGDLQLLEDLLNVLKEPYTQTDNLLTYQQPATLTDKKYKTFCGT